ncbi:hypothetical protein OG21DRAFT_1488110 [Imleria badia]|nr:hypothetical protein OG21DRAFT_1488110 [Imleria badia]
MQVDETPTESKGKEVVDDQATPKNALIFRRQFKMNMDNQPQKLISDMLQLLWLLLAP